MRSLVERAAAAGVTAVVTVADDLESARWVTRAAEWDRRVYAAVALHPTRADALTDAARAELERLVAHPRVVAVGETGIDMYWPVAWTGVRSRTSSGRPLPGISIWPSGPVNR